MKVRYLLLHAYGTGGTIRTVFNQADAMAAAGHDVEVVSALRGGDAPRFPVDPRVRIHALTDQRGGGVLGGGPRGWTRRLRALRQRGRPPLEIPRGEFAAHRFDRGVETAVIRWLRRLGGGVLVTTRPALNLLAARHAPPAVVRIAQEHMNLGSHRPDVRAAIARLYGRFDAVAVLTDRDRRDYQGLLPGTRVVRIPNAVHSLDQVPADRTGRIAVAAGRLLGQKGFDLLVPAFAGVVERHPDWQLRIYGTGRKKAQLRGLIEKHHLYNNVLLMGHTARLDDELAKSAFYVLSSRFEGLPMVMIEAMAHALPIVGFDCPTGPADVLTHGEDGLLVPPGEVPALTAAMLRLVEDPSLRARLGAAAARTARSYAPDVVHPQWERLFAELSASRARRRGQAALWRPSRLAS